MTHASSRTPKKKQALQKPRTPRSPKAAQATNALEQSAQALAALIRHKGGDGVVLLSVGSVSDYTDYLIIATGSSTTTVRALANYVLDWGAEHNLKALGIEGMEQPDWVLLDLGPIVVHLFVPEARAYYAIESLWLDARTVPIPLPSK